MLVHTIDLHFLDASEAIAAYLIPTENGAALVECGPHSTLPQLLEGIHKFGYQPSDIHSLFLTHIHFDHAGAAWWFAQQGTKVYVHPRGYKHLLAPERLYESARMIYQNKMDMLWGEMNPIAEDKLTAVEDKQLIHFDDQQIQAIHSPGHAVHHISWLINDILFTGDVGGVKIANGPVVPPCPPPDINVEDWVTSVEAMLAVKAKRWYLTHYGHIDQIEPHAQELLSCLHRYADWMKVQFDLGDSQTEITARFVEFVEADFRSAGLSETTIAAYNAANPPWMSVAGLLRYWKKRQVS